jgi:echinoid
LGVSVDPTCLALVAIVESVINGNTPMAAWQVIDQVPLTVSGNSATYKEFVIDDMTPARRSSARSLGDDELPPALDDELNLRVRVKLCLKSNVEHCSDYKDAISKFYSNRIGKLLKCGFFSFQLALHTFKRQPLWPLQQ